jgi:carbon monoxide dehydrogenase subunit G
MILKNEFTVGGDVETVWKALLDMERVAGCLPGATITASGDNDTYNGSMKVKIGPMAVTYQGTAKLSEVDDEHHRAVISLRAREAKGQGTAMATITNRVEPHDGGTRVTAETDLHITGPQARFGHGIMEDVGGRVLEEFSRRLEQEIRRPATPASGSPPNADALDVGAALSESAAARTARKAVPIVLALLVLLVLRRRR